MKKSLVLMAMAGVALASCVGNEVEEITPKKELSKIQFAAPMTYDNVETRRVPGEIVSGLNSYPTDETFVVFGKKYTDLDYPGWASSKLIWGTAENPSTVVKYNPDLSGWEPIDSEGNYKSYYWNTDMKAAFAAVSPSQLNSEATITFDDDNGFIISDFQVEGTAKEQYDLMYSTLSTNVTTSNQTHHGYSGTIILFHHALSSLRFAIVGDKEAVLTGLAVHNVKDKGTFTQNNPTPWALDENSKGNWDIYKDITVNFTESPQFILDLLNKQNAYKEQGYKEAKNFLMIPQTLTNSSTEFNPNTDPHLEVYYTDKNHVKQVSVVPLADFFGGTWNQGTRHIYILSLGGSSKIFFAPGVDSWLELEHDEVIQLDAYHDDEHVTNNGSDAND